MEFKGCSAATGTNIAGLIADYIVAVPARGNGASHDYLCEPTPKVTTVNMPSSFSEEEFGSQRQVSLI